MKFYLMGGAVRDLLLGQTPRDYDYSFAGEQAEFLQYFPQARHIQSSRHIFIVDGHEYTQLRGSVENDLLERDFTINAFALTPDGILQSHPLALQDLHNSILRPTTDTALINDPIRIFRLARFTSQFPKFTIAPECTEQAEYIAHHALLATIPAEQIAKEVRKALATPQPSRFLKVLTDLNCLEPWFTEFCKADTIPAGPAQWHGTNTVLQHVGEVLDYIAEKHSSFTFQHKFSLELCQWMALCHDLGKINTPADILPHHYAHEKRGTSLAVSLGTRIKLPQKMIKAGELGASLHMLAGSYNTLTPKKRVPLLMQAHTQALTSELFFLACADMFSKPSEKQETAQQFITTIEQELTTILATKLPKEFCNKGILSQQKLQLLQTQALQKK